MSNLRDIFIAITSNDTYEEVDAVVLLEGDGYARIEHACSILLNGFAKKLIFSGGILNKNNGSYSFDMCERYIKNKGVKKSQLILELKSTNTKEQAEEVIKLCLYYNWNRIILVASHYHQYRAFLTFLKHIIKSRLNKNFIIYNAPVKKLPWFEKTEWGISRFNLLTQEFKKITLYKKDVASFKEAIDYFQWREQQKR
jgi:uncharacterized SAM-binding protein YcdF (DUF218 family)